MRLSDDAIERSIERYQQLLAARQHDPPQLAAASADVDAVILRSEGLQPEKGPDTLYVVRALERKRVWCAEALLSRAAAAGQPLLAQARHWAAGLGKPVRLGIAETQEALVRGSAAAFPGVPQRYGATHFVRDVAQPVLEADSRAKVPRRHKVRGWRTMERAVFAAQRTPAPSERPEGHSEASPSEPLQADAVPQDVVLDDGAAVRGMLHDAQGGPRPPPGRRMAEAFKEVHAALQRHREAKKGGQPTSGSPAEQAPGHEV